MMRQPWEEPPPFRQHLAEIKRHAEPHRSAAARAAAQLGTDAKVVEAARAEVLRVAAAANTSAADLDARKGDLKAARAMQERHVREGDAAKIATWTATVSKATAAVTAAEGVLGVHRQIVTEAEAALSTAERTRKTHERDHVITAFAAADADLRLAIVAAAERIAAEVAPQFQRAIAAEAAASALAGDHPAVNAIRSGAVQPGTLATRLFQEALTSR